MNAYRKPDNLRWKLKTAAFKKMICLQDRFGLYSYHRWIDENELSSKHLAKQSFQVKTFKNKPVFVFLIPFDEESHDDLIYTYRAIKEQTYSYWNVHIISKSTHIYEVAELEGDTRVNIQLLTPDTEVNQATVAATESAKGDYLIVAKPGDVPAPNLLFEAAESLQNNSKHDIVYYDEDYLGTGEGERLEPFFKPDWSPELMISINYLIHAAFRIDLFVEIIHQTGSDPIRGYGDLTFRATESASKIHHIPEVLYHKRTRYEIPSQADLLTHCRNVEGHLTRQGISDPRANLVKDNHVRVSWPVPKVTVSIIIPTKDNLEYLQTCIRSILQFTKSATYEIILIDSGSQEEQTHKYYAEITKKSNIQLISYNCGDNFNFNTALNLGASHSQGEILLFLNNDTEILDSEWFDEMVRWAARPEVGIVGAKLLYPNHTIQQAGIVIGMEGHASHVFAGIEEGYQGPFGSVSWYRNYSAVTGACMAIRRQVFEQVGGFDEDYTLVFSDVQFCLQVIEAGYRVVYTPYARLIHHEGQSRFSYIPDKDIQLAYSHFKHIVKKGDPYYNPNLSHAVRIPTFKRKNEEVPLERLEKIVSDTNN